MNITKSGEYEYRKKYYAISGWNEARKQFIKNHPDSPFGVGFLIKNGICNEIIFRSKTKETLKVCQQYMTYLIKLIEIDNVFDDEDSIFDY